MPSSDPRVSFCSATYDQASTASIVNGRIIGVTDKDAIVYDLDNSRHIINSSDIVVDSSMSSTSVNPVQNRIISEALEGKASTLSLSDGSVTKIGTADVGSTTNPIYINAGVPTAVAGPIPVSLGGTGNASVDTVPTEGSTKMVTSGGIYTALQNVDIDVDSAISSTSTNPVENQAIYAALQGKQSTLSFDATPTANSTNPVTSGGVYTALQNVDIDVDSALDDTSTNPVENRVIYAALENVQSKLTFDSVPTENSTNPVTSGGIYTYVANAIAANMTVDLSISATPPSAAPASPQTTIYIVFVPAGEESGNLYDEYIWISSGQVWEKLGTQSVDLSGYQEKIVAGNNITINADGKTINSVHPTITVGTDTTSTDSPALGGIITVVDSVTRDSNGHVTAINVKSVTLPTYSAGSNISITNGEISSSHPEISTQTDTTSTATPSAGGDISVVDAVTRDSNGHVTKINTKTVTLPNTVATLSTPRSLTTDLASTVSASFDGSANASIGVTGVLPVINGGTGQSSVDDTPTENSAKMVKSGGVYAALADKQDTIIAGNNITINPDGKTINSSHPSVTARTNTTSTATPDFGETFTVIDSITTDTNGHVTAVNTKTVTIPAMYWVTPQS